MDRVPTPATDADAVAPSHSVSGADLALRQPFLTDFVGRNVQTAPSFYRNRTEADRPRRLTEPQIAALSDAQLQDYINTCAHQFIAANDRYEATGCFGDCADRDNWWDSERDALIERGCRPHVVARGN